MYEYKPTPPMLKALRLRKWSVYDVHAATSRVLEGMGLARFDLDKRMFEITENGENYLASVDADATDGQSTQEK